MLHKYSINTNCKFPIFQQKLDFSNDICYNNIEIILTYI